MQKLTDNCPKIARYWDRSGSVAFPESGEGIIRQWHFECRETSAHFSLWPNPESPHRCFKWNTRQGFPLTYMQFKVNGCSVSKNHSRVFHVSFQTTLLSSLKPNGSHQQCYTEPKLLSAGGSRHLAHWPHKSMLSLFPTDDQGKTGASGILGLGVRDAARNKKSRVHVPVLCDHRTGPKSSGWQWYEPRELGVVTMNSSMKETPRMNNLPDIWKLLYSMPRPSTHTIPQYPHKMKPLRGLERHYRVPIS